MWWDFGGEGMHRDYDFGLFVLLPIVLISYYCANWKVWKKWPFEGQPIYGDYAAYCIVSLFIVLALTCQDIYAVYLRGRNGGNYSTSLWTYFLHEMRGIELDRIFLGLLLTFSPLFGAISKNMLTRRIFGIVIASMMLLWSALTLIHYKGCDFCCLLAFSHVFFLFPAALATALNKDGKKVRGVWWGILLMAGLCGLVLFNDDAFFRFFIFFFFLPFALFCSLIAIGLKRFFSPSQQKKETMCRSLPPTEDN